MKKRFLFLSFIEGATVMAVELCGARLLSPVFGSSLYVWASVLGITLLALASGYFTGGWWSAKAKNPAKRLFFVLSLASLMVMLMPFSAEYFVPRIAFISFLPAMFGATWLLLFAPVFFLGATSPLLVMLQSKSNFDAGKISGLVYAISTLGGILATFLCGFYLMPHWGLKITLLFFGALLFVSSALFLRTFSMTQSFVAAGLLFLNLQSEIKNNTIKYASEGIMGRVEVLDLNYEHKTIRLLKVNDIIQSEMDLASGQSVSEYVRIFDTLSAGYPFGSNALVLGLGAGLTSNVLVNKKFKVQAVEFDERVIYAGQNYFGLDEKVEVINDDARHFLNGTTGIYDLVLVDVFKAEEQPSHVITRESLSKLKTQLKKNARIVINWHGYTTGKLGKGTCILYQTLLNQGFQVKFCSNSNDEHHRNLMLVASLEKLPELAFEVHPVLEKTTHINTDDKPLLEEANALANLSWRNLYLRHYTGQ